MAKEELDDYYRDMENQYQFRDGVITGHKLIEAVKQNDVEEVKRLLALSVEDGGLILLRLIQKDERGKTAFEIANENSFDEIIALLSK